MPERTVQLPLWDDENFWQIESEKFAKALLPFIVALVTEGAETGLTAIGVTFDAAAFNVIAERYAATYTYELVKQINDASRDYLQGAITDWVRSGEHLNALIGQITDSGMFGAVRSQMIATTEATRMFAEGNLAGWRESGVVSGKRWNTAADELVCPICAPLEGQVVGLDDPFGDEFSDPPAHVNCLPGNTLVLPIGRVAAGSERWYEGDIVVIETLENQLTVTPNHPVLTRRGWVGAGQLKQGDHVLAYSPRQWSTAINTDYQNRITAIQNIFGSLNLGGFRMPISAPDFHGDGGNSKIAAICTNRQIVRDGYIHIGQPMAQLDFGWRDVVGKAVLSRFGASASLGMGNFASTSHRVSGRILASALLDSHAPPFDRLGLGLIARSNSTFEQMAADDLSIDIEAFSQAVLALAGSIAESEIIRIRKTDFSGHVYNLQTETELYIAAGIITHNCRCGIQPVLKQT